jgi:hypothetical protein
MAVGKSFFRLVKKVPVIFLLVCIGGLTIGIGAWFDFGQPKDSRTIFLKCLGVGVILFYGWLMVLHLVKRLKGTWSEFCDRNHQIFENLE